MGVLGAVWVPPDGGGGYGGRICLWSFEGKDKDNKTCVLVLSDLDRGRIDFYRVLTAQGKQGEWPTKIPVRETQ